MLAAEEHTFVHDRVDAAELFQRHILAIGHLDDAGIVHENIEPAEAVRDLGRHAQPCRLVGDVQRQGDRAVADPVGHRLRGGQRDVRDDHGRAFPRQYDAIGGAKPRCAARDQRDLAFHPAGHRRLLPSLPDDAQAAPLSSK